MSTPDAQPPATAADQGPSARRGQALRQHAEAIEATFPEPSAASLARREALSWEDTERMLHELRVHQIELEMQNEELRRAQTILDSERARYFDLYDLAPVGYCTLSEQGLILQANLATATLLSGVRKALIAQPISRFILKADQDVYYLHRRKVLETRTPQACELRMVKCDGTSFWAHLASTAAHEVDGVLVLRVVLSDVSERKSAEAEQASCDQALQKKNVELERAKVVAEKANLAKSEFLSSMSHELRTPLSAILGFAQLLESGSPPPTLAQQRSIAQILKAGWHLLGLINEVLDLALIESGKLLLAVEPVPLHEIMSECRDMVEPLAEQHGVRLSFGEIENSCCVQADRKRLKQILINLLANAIKYNRADGAVAVEFSPSPPEAIRISVRDTGAGLNQEQLAQLFQPFNRLGQEATSEEGTGIGLVMCQRLIESLGGVIGVDSTAGEGSTFWIELTLSSAGPASVGASASASTAPAQAAVRVVEPWCTLLYIEDNTANLMLVEEIIARRDDIRLLSARDGQRGIAMARAYRPDVILMDISLPDISGLEALKVLAGDPATAHIPVMALSANALPRDIEEGLKAGFFRYLTKPIGVTEFMETLDVALAFARKGAGKHASAGPNGHRESHTRLSP
jgi:PAS domain S-box-containing protein